MCTYKLIKVTVHIYLFACVFRLNYKSSRWTISLKIIRRCTCSNCVCTSAFALIELSLQCLHLYQNNKVKIIFTLFITTVNTALKMHFNI